MAPGRNVDDDAPPTKAEEWIGATKILRHGAKPHRLKSAMTFFIFQASTESSLFAVTDANDASRLPECPENGHWTLFKSVEETGQPRIGFSETEAKSDIKDQGYHLSRVRISAQESAA